MTEKKHAIVILETCKDDMGNFIPCIVKEDETGYYTTDWKWGTDLKEANKLAKEYNTKLGLTQEEAYSLVLQSMRPADTSTNNNPYIGTAQNMTDLADKYNIDPASFIFFWKERFPEHGPTYMEDWARRIRNRQTDLFSDNTTRSILIECNLGDDRI